MNETEFSNRENRVRTALPVLILLGITANLLLTITLHREVTMLGQVVPRRPDLPCAAIPTRFVAQEPICAQKLIDAMNVTNFQVLANESQLEDLLPKPNNFTKAERRIG